MASITTRAAKGTPLTHAEVDANFTNLNTDKLDVAGIALGTAASPTVKFTGDTNTGLYSPGADQLSISTGGTERFRIDNNGQLEAVSLGSAASPTYTFTTDPDTGLYSPGANQVALATGGTGRVFVDSAGNVGIGTTGPRARTELSRASAPTSTAIANSYLQLGGAESGAGSYRLITFGGVGESQAPAYIGYLQTNATASTFGDLVFGTRSITTNDPPSERLRIDGSGRLLVGTSSSEGAFFNSSNVNFQVEVQSQYYLQSWVSNNSSNVSGAHFVIARSRGSTPGSKTVVQNGDNIGLFSFQGADGTEFVEAARIEAAIDGTPGANDMPGRLVFSTTADGASSATERMRIKNNGTINFSNVATYADNAAATAGGLAVGDVYRTSTGQLMIRY